MRTSRIIRLVVRIFLYFFTICLTVVSLLGGLSAITIISNPDNIGVPDGPIIFNFDATTKQNNNITVPFNFTNDGYFELTNLNVHVRLNMTYDHYSGGGVSAPNVTTTINIFDGNQTIQPIPASDFFQPGINVYKGNLTGTWEDFGDIPDFNNISWVAPVTFSADLIVSASYSLELLSFKVEILNQSVTAFLF